MKKKQFHIGYKLKMRRLLDQFTPLLFLLLLIVKGLQLFKKIGIYAKEDGWRRATRAFFRTEHSKFSLALFKLDLWSDIRIPEGVDSACAQAHFMRRFALFLAKHPAIHWEITWRYFSARREQKNDHDFLCVSFDGEGHIESVETFFQLSAAERAVISTEVEKKILDNFISVYNVTKFYPDTLRPIVLKQRIQAQVRRIAEYRKEHKSIWYRFVHRILSSTCVHFEILPASKEEAAFVRLAPVNFIRKKHPGWGTLNVLVRFAADYRDVDVWFQIQHIPVDGAQMQDVLNALRYEWGISGNFIIPAQLLNRHTIPHVCSTDTGKSAVYSTMLFASFEKFFVFRKELADTICSRVTSIPVVGLLIWLLGHHPAFHERKFLFTIDLSESEFAARRPGFVFVRPSMYAMPSNALEGFIQYITIFNERLHATRNRQSESYELLELYALFSPIMYTVLHRVLPASLADLIGSVGVTMMKDSDLFIAPSSDIHTGGFLAFSNFSIPTDRGGTAGIVSIKASKEIVEKYAQAIYDVLGDCSRYF